MFFFLILFTFTLKVGAKGNASADVDHHLEMGKRLLAAGQLTEALSHYHSAIGLHNISFQSHFFYTFISFCICITCFFIFLISLTLKQLEFAIASKLLNDKGFYS